MPPPALAFIVNSLERRALSWEAQALGDLESLGAIANSVAPAAVGAFGGPLLALAAMVPVALSGASRGGTTVASGSVVARRASRAGRPILSVAYNGIKRSVVRMAHALPMRVVMGLFAAHFVISHHLLNFWHAHADKKFQSEELARELEAQVRNEQIQMRLRASQARMEEEEQNLLAKLSLATEAEAEAQKKAKRRKRVKGMKPGQVAEIVRQEEQAARMEKARIQGDLQALSLEQARVKSDLQRIQFPNMLA